MLKPPPVTTVPAGQWAMASALEPPKTVVKDETSWIVGVVLPGVRQARPVQLSLWDQLDPGDRSDLPDRCRPWFRVVPGGVRARYGGHRRTRCAEHDYADCRSC